MVRYPQTGGYTPGDVYELFIGNDNRIRQWIYRRGDEQKPTRITTWEDYRWTGPLMISLTRKSRDDDFRVWFTEVAVKIVGEQNWYRAE